jgi:alpha-beta hydrolase superfamily lysophospholipase
MKHTTQFVTSYDGLQLFTQHWLPDEACCAHLILIHGLGEHASRHAHVAQYFVERQFAVHALDLRGHGRSAGKRGHANTLHDSEKAKQWYDRVDSTHKKLLFFENALHEVLNEPKREETLLMIYEWLISALAVQKP